MRTSQKNALQNALIKSLPKSLPRTGKQALFAHFSIVLALIGAYFFPAELLQSERVKIIDGDTLELVIEGEQLRVRLGQIDAPELKQAFGEQSKNNLQALCLGKIVRLQEDTKDKYGRIVGDVFCDEINVNQAQIKDGMAWVYKGYAKDKSLYLLEQNARQNRLGIWAAKNPTPPWEYRKKHAQNEF